MKHIKIRNLGPLSDVDIRIKKLNVIIGPQSSGKSCVLKVACYCTWVEKRIELTQNPGFFQQEDKFINELIRFHKLKGYVKPDTYIEYESDFMQFSYDHASRTFRFSWKEKRWEYRRPKVTYVPAERNMVAVIPNWFDVKLADDNIRDFMSDWEAARKATGEHLQVLNLDVSYRYEPSSNTDKVKLDNGEELEFTHTSSGLQSLIPLYVHLNYLTRLQDGQEKSESVKRFNENRQLLQNIYADLFMDDIISKTEQELFWGTIHNAALPFSSPSAADRCREIYSRYADNHFCDIFLEEPEENLFPPTQVQLVRWLTDMTAGTHGSNLFIATHSPYVITALLENPCLDPGLFFTYTGKGKSYVKTASGQDIQDILGHALKYLRHHKYDADENELKDLFQK